MRMLSVKKKMKKAKETLTEVNVNYARFVVILLACNLLLTGYTISKISATDSEILEQEDQETQSTTD